MFKTLKEEVCNFQIAHLVKNDCDLDDLGIIWYKNKYSLFDERSEIKDNKDIPFFLESPKNNG